MAAARASAGSRRLVLASAAFFPAWWAAALVGLGRRVGVALGLYGFVLHAVFGKGYALLPSYFDRDLAWPRAPTLHLPLSTLGTVGLAAAGAGVGPDALGAAGAALWAAGAVVFVATLGWTARDNPLGAETGTGEANADRRAVDRVANLAFPAGLAYLLAGAYAGLAARSALPVPLDGYPPRATHLLAAGVGALFVFAVGVRLLPRFFVATPPRPLVAVVLPAGTLGPALLAAGLPAGALFRLGAAVEAVAVVAFALLVATLARRTDRRRAGFVGVGLGALAGVAGVGLGAAVAFGHAVPGFALAHARLNVGGFLGLTVVGVAYQFYPPTVGTFPGASDRTALGVLAAVAGGLAAQAAGALGGLPWLVTAGEAASLAGAAAHAGLLAALFAERYGVFPRI